MFDLALDEWIAEPGAEPVTITYATSSDTASSSDYSARTATVTIPAGASSRFVNVPVRPDAVDELDETFFLNLSAPVNASMPDPQAQATIIDSDPTPQVSIGDVTSAEGDSGTRTFTFSVTMSGKSSRTVTADFITVDDTATAPRDYTAKTGTVSFAPGTTSPREGRPV